MKRKLLLLLAVVSIGTTVWATDPEAINVVRTDAAISSTLLDDVQLITFNEEETIMTIIETDATTHDFPLVDVSKVVFGAYVPEDNPNTEVETPVLEVSDGVRKVLENGHLIIIKDGVRYNVLGIRL